jgi:predicted LPLAT superfamily acyltransferase
MKVAQTNSGHWTRQKEKVAGYWLLKFLLFLFRLFPVVLLRLIAFPVGFFYFLFSSKARTESQRYLEKAAPCIDNAKTSKKCRSRLGPLRHIISFSLTLV